MAFRLFFLLALLSFCRLPSAALIGVDLGSEFVKVAVIKSGSGLDIVLNEQTKRKTKAYVGFRNKERYFGEDAYNLHTRFPSAMITYLKHLVGVTASDSGKWKELYKFPFFLLNATSRNTLKVDVDEKAVYTAEELLGMYLAMLKEMAEKHTEQMVTDCMIAVPASYSPRQLQAVSDAARLVNLNVLSFIHDTTAAALQYGVQQRGFDAQTNVVVVDMGSSKLEVGVFTFGPKADESKKSKAFDSVGLGSLQVRAIESDINNGGRVYDAIIAEHLAHEFAERTGVNVLAEDNANGHKAVAKLMRTAQKVKETLSANKDAKASVEGIWEETDFNTVLSRDQFESMAQPLFARAIDVFKRAVAKAGLTMAEVDSVELMGGGSRIPALQSLLLEAFGKKQLGRTLNTDEAIALGATFHGARLSGAFRVRSFALVEHDVRNVSFSLSATPSNPQPAVRPLFLQSRYPTKKLVTVFRAQDFNVTLHEGAAAAESGADAPTPTQRYVVKDVASAFAKMGVASDNVNSESKQYVELKFRLADCGMVTLDSAVAKFDHVKNVTRLVKVKNTTSALVASEVPSSQTATEKEGEEEEEEEPVEAKGAATEAKTKAGASEGESKGSNPPEAAPQDASQKSATAKEEPKFQQVNTTKVVHKKELLTVLVVPLGEPKPMEARDFTDATYTINKLKKRDMEKLEIAHAKNTLEAFIISMKYDGFFEDEGLKEYYDDAEADTIRSAMREVEDWMEQADGSATAATYEQKVKRLKALIDPILKRRVTKEQETFKQATAAEQPIEEAEAAGPDTDNVDAEATPKPDSAEAEL